MFLLRTLALEPRFWWLKMTGLLASAIVKLYFRFRGNPLGLKLVKALFPLWLLRWLLKHRQRLTARLLTGYLELLP